MPLGILGCDFCDGPEALGRVEGLALLPDTTVAVLDLDEPFVRLFASDGRVVGSFGRRGEGPGEVRLPEGIAAVAGRLLAVSDIGANSVTLYDLAGKALETHRAESTVTQLRGSPDGRWLTFQEARWATMSAGVHLLDSGLRRVATPVPDTDGLLFDESGESAAPGLFGSAPGPDGRVALGHGSVYVIEVVGRGGDPLHTIARDVPRRARTTEEIDAIVERRRRAMRLRRGDHPEAGATGDGVDPLDAHFGLGALAYDAAGRLWVGTNRGGPSATVFDVFGDDGEFLREIEVSPAVRHFTVAHGVLAAVAEDPSTGVPRVHLWGLPPRLR